MGAFAFAVLVAYTSAAQPAEFDHIDDLGPLVCLTDEQTVSPLDGKDRPTLVVFWTPLCEPSLRAVANLPTLASTNHANGWRFIAVTFHGSDDVAPAIDELGLAGTDAVQIVSDDHGAAFRAAGIAGTPVAALFNSDGSLHAVTHPSFITAETLDRIAAGQRPDLPISDMVEARVADDAWDLRVIEASGNEPPTVEIESVKEPGSLSKFDPETGIILVPGAPASSLLASALDLPQGRLDFSAADGAEDQLLRVKIVPADGSLVTARRQLAEALRTKLGWQWSTRQEMRDAWVIETGSRPLSRSQATEPSVQWMGPRFSGVATVADVAKWLEAITGTPAVDRTALERTLLDIDLELRARADIFDAFESVGLRVEQR
ncbi:MAG: hypothetical protein AAFO89_12450, partial [Planctomycetota bacterium]